MIRELVCSKKKWVQLTEKNEARHVFLELGGTSIDLMTGVSMTLDLGEKNLYTADKVRIKKAAATTLTSGSIVVIGYRGA